MALKDILVHVDNTKSCATRLETVMALALENDAHVTGVYAYQKQVIPAFIQAQIGQSVLDEQARQFEKMRKQAEIQFAEITNRAGVRSEWRSIEGEAFEVLRLHARYSDLLVLGQYDPGDDANEGLDDLPDRLVLACGRPVLMVPYAGKFEDMSRRVMVAWDGSRLACRALNDALPLMEQAKAVDVLSVNPQDADKGHHAFPGADICLHLARHGVNAEAHHIIADDMDAGDMLLSRAADEGASMLVMGAYGHRRLRELVLGGVTHHILKHMTLPVLMSH